MISGVLEDESNFYEFCFDEEEVKEFNEKIKNEASKVEHRDYISSRSPFVGVFPIYNKNIKNKIVEDAGWDKIGRKRFHYVYDVYEYPYLSILIDRFLSGDMDSLFEIIHPNFDKEYIPSIDKITSEIKALSNNNYDKETINEIVGKIQSLKDTLLDIKKGNIYIPAAKYYSDFLSLINLRVKDVNSLELKNKTF